MNADQERIDELLKAHAKYSLELKCGGMSEEETQATKDILTDIEVTLQEDFGYEI